MSNNKSIFFLWKCLGVRYRIPRLVVSRSGTGPRVNPMRTVSGSGSGIYWIIASHFREILFWEYKIKQYMLSVTYLITFSPTVSDISTSYFQIIQRRTNLNSIPVEKFTKILAITYTPFLDSGARGPGFETYRRRVVSLSKTLYSPKVLVNYPGSDGSVPT